MHLGLAAIRLASCGQIVELGHGQGATDGVAWGDYSGSTIDGDNLVDLWTIQSIADDQGKGDTIIAKVPLSDPMFLESAPPERAPDN